jgi:hypothetical protein
MVEEEIIVSRIEKNRDVVDELIPALGKALEEARSENQPPA